MYEDKYGARLDRIQEMIDELRKDLEGFKKDQIEKFAFKLSILEKTIVLFEQKQNNLLAKFWFSFILNFVLGFAIVILFLLFRAHNL